MPRKPTNEVIEHRISLGTWERQRADELLNAIEFKQIASPIVDVISDKDAIVVVSLALAAVGAIVGSISLGALAAVLVDKYGEELTEVAKENFKAALVMFWEASVLDDLTAVDELYVGFKLIYEQYNMTPPSIVSFSTEWLSRKLPKGGDGVVGGLDIATIISLIRGL